MHEYAIAEAIVRIAGEHARGRRVERVEVKVGRLRQVVPASLRFGFEVASAGTLSEGAELAIEEVPVRGVCSSCGEATVMAGFPLRCAKCGALDLEIVSGEELLVEALELAGQEEATSVPDPGDDGATELVPKDRRSRCTEPE